MHTFPRSHVSRLLGAADSETQVFNSQLNGLGIRIPFPVPQSVWSLAL